MTSARPRHVRAALLVLPLLLVAASGCDIAIAELAEKETAEWRKTFPLRAGGQLEIGNVNGRIDIRRGNGAAVEVVARKTARASTSDAAKQTLARIEIRESSSADAIKLETHFERAAGGLFRNANFEVEYTVTVPASTVLKVSTINGGVEIAGVNGRITAETTNGGVRGRDIGGPIEATTTNGGVDVDLSAVTDGGVKLECTNGGVKLSLPADSRATVSARVTNGGIDTGNLKMALHGAASSRRLDGDLNGGGPRISLEGTNGGITIRGR